MCFEEFEARYRSEYAKFYTFLSTFYEENNEKEEYFRTARDILQTREQTYKAFVRLVVGWSSLDAASVPSNDAVPRSLSDKSFGGAFAESESDILSLAIGGESTTSRPGGLVPTADGLGWQPRSPR